MFYLFWINISCLYPRNQSLTPISSLNFTLLYPGSGVSEDESGPPAHFSEDAVDELLKPDQDEMDVDEEDEKGGDGDSSTNNDSFFSLTSSPNSNKNISAAYKAAGAANSKPAPDSASVADSDSFLSFKSRGPASQRSVSAAYKSVRAAKLAALTCRSLATGSSTPLSPTGSLMDTRDGRNFMSFQVNSFSAKRNLTASFDTASLTCKTCELKPDHTVLFSSKNLDPKIQPEPVVFILADQSFPACVPAGGTGHCLKIIRLEDGSLAELSNVFLETIQKHILPAGSVVLLHSLSHLKWVGTAAYAEDFVRSRQRILATYRSGLSVLHGLPILAEGSTDSSLANDLLAIVRWYSLVLNPADRDIQATRSAWSGILIDNAVQSSTAAPPLHTCSGVQPSATPTDMGSKPSALPASRVSTASPLASTGLELPSASSPTLDLSSTSSTLLNCSPSAQGSVLLKLRLPTSLDSLKPIVFQAQWLHGIQLSPTGEDGEREIFSKLISEINLKFNANLDKNFSTSRDVEADVEESCADYNADSIIIVGSSHAFRLAAAFNSLGESVNCLASPFWKLDSDNIDSTVKSLEEAVRCNPTATVLFQLFDSRVYFASSEEGELTLPKRGNDGHFHVPGELVLADWAALKKIFTTALPLIRAGGSNKKIILSPLPRYVNAKCCTSATHITNFGGKAYAKAMGSQLADIHGWLDDLARGRRLQNYEIICPASALGVDDNASISDKSTQEGLRSRWGTDPVHLTPAGYNTLAESLIANLATTEQGVPVKPAPPLDREKRKEGLSTSDWAANRWESDSAPGGRRGGKDVYRGRKMEESGHAGKRHKR